MANFGRTEKAAKTVQQRCDEALSAGGVMNSGDLIEVDYFAVCVLLDFFKEHKEAAKQVVKVRDAFHQLYFTSDLSS